MENHTQPIYTNESRKFVECKIEFGMGRFVACVIICNERQSSLWPSITFSSCEKIDHKIWNDNLHEPSLLIGWDNSQAYLMVVSICGIESAHESTIVPHKVETSYSGWSFRIHMQPKIWPNYLHHAINSLKTCLHDLKVCECYLVTFLNWTLVFNWCVSRWLSKNKDHKDARFNEINPCL